MYFRHIILTLTVAALTTGCSTRSGFFEDLYSQTEVISAAEAGYGTSKKSRSKYDPIVHDTEQDKLYNEEVKKKKTRQKQQIEAYTTSSSREYHTTGKIIDASYDKDVNLYVYAFLQSGKSNPISFYYDKDLRDKVGKTSTVYVKENFLISISGIGTVTENAKKSTRDVKKSTERKYKKRKISHIQAPDVEKINTLY